MNGLELQSSSRFQSTVDDLLPFLVSDPLARPTDGFLDPTQVSKCVYVVVQVQSSTVADLLFFRRHKYRL